MTWSGLKVPAGLLEEGVKAPLLLSEETALAFRASLEKLLEDIPIPRGVLEAALSTGSGLLRGAQEVLRSLNQLLEADAAPSKVRETVYRLLLACHALFRLRNAAYVLQQVGEIAAEKRDPSRASELPRIRRLKDYMTPLEKRLEALEVTKLMEADRLAALLVHLDELYDDASLLLQRLFYLASRDISEARTLAPEFLRRLYSDFAKGSLGDNLPSEEPAEEKGGRKAGLFELLPELLEALEGLSF